MLPWVRLDANFYTNPKILGLLDERDGHRAAFVYCCSLAYCGGHGTDGFVPREAAIHIHCRASDAEKLVRHRLWDASDGGWTVHDWHDKQASSAETEARRKRAQAAAQARWSGKPKKPRSNA